MEKKRSLADDLAEYGRRSVRNFGNGVDDVRALVAEAQKSIPPSVDEAAGVAASLMPGYGVMEAMRLGSDSGRQWREGAYGDALITMGHAVDAPFNEVLWAVPGGGFVKRIVK